MFAKSILATEIKQKQHTPSLVKAGTASPLFRISFVSLILKPSIVVLISLGYTGSWGFHNMRGTIDLFLGL